MLLPLVYPNHHHHRHPHHCPHHHHPNNPHQINIMLITCEYIRGRRRPYNCQVNQAEQRLLTEEVRSTAIPLRIFVKMFSLFIRNLLVTRPKPAFGRQGLDWIVRPVNSFVVVSTNRGILTSFGAKTWPLLTGGSNWPPLVQKRDRYSQGGPTDLLDV